MPRRIRRLIYFAAALALCQGLAISAAIAVPGLLAMRAGTAFSGEVGGANQTCRIDLALEAHQGFVLTETRFAGKRKRQKSVSGSWYTLSGGRRLQLTNRHGYYRVLTVGSDNLYLETPHAPLEYATVVLRPVPEGGEICRGVSGPLRIRNGLAVLHDEATGLAYALPGLPAEAIPEACRAEADCKVIGTGCGANADETRPPRLRALTLKRADRPLPRVWRATPQTFGLRVTDADWLLVSPETLVGPVLVRLRFQNDVKKPGRGTAVLRGRGTARRIPYALDGDRIILEPGTGIALPPELASALASPLAWSVDGERLELRAPGGMVSVWERNQQ